MAVKVYDLADIPTRRRRSSDAELKPYLDALKNGKGAGDGVAYGTREEAAKAVSRIVTRARRSAKELDLPYPGGRVWQDRAGKWFWAIVPSARRGGGEGGKRRGRRPAATAGS
jgi:hypothetical protein